MILKQCMKNPNTSERTQGGTTCQNDVMPSNRIDGRYRIMMVGTDIAGRGGISSVVQGYYSSGIMDRLGIQYYPTHKDGTRFDKLLFYVKAISKIAVNMQKYQLVHVHTASLWSYRRLFPIVLLSKILRKKTVIHLHGGKFDIYYSQSFSLEQLFIEYGFSLADKIILLSKEWSNKAQIFLDAQKTVVIQNSVPFRKLTRETLIRKGKKPRILLFMGDMLARKGVYDILTALKLLNCMQLKLKLFLCGQGETEKVKQRASDLDLDSFVVVPGWVSGEKKQGLLERAYIYLFPSYREQLPISLLEAMATGTPVITTPVGGIPSVVKEGFNGFLVPVNSPEQIASRIEKILSDESLWHGLSRNAFETVERSFSVENMEEQLRELYKGLNVQPRHYDCTPYRTSEKTHIVRPAEKPMSSQGLIT